jgi:hypothetical protein
MKRFRAIGRRKFLSSTFAAIARSYGEVCSTGKGRLWVADDGSKGTAQKRLDERRLKTQYGLQYIAYGLHFGTESGEVSTREESTRPRRYLICAQQFVCIYCLSYLNQSQLTHIRSFCVPFVTKLTQSPT